MITIPELDAVTWMALAGGLVALVVLVVWWVVRRRRKTARLRDRFGSEYRRTVEETGGRRAAETDLEERLELHRHLDLRPMSMEARRRFTEGWRSIQLRFVDEPTEAVREAERLAREAMGELGYPIDDVEDRVAALSVDFPHLAERYRRAHGLSLDPEEEPLPTEELRQVLLDYRLLLEELMQEEEPAEGEVEEPIG